MTVDGPIPMASLGITLIHEHFLVDFIGADKTNYGRWDRDRVVKKVAPFLIAAKDKGVKCIFDCTPAFLGRDPHLLKILSQKSGLNIITNTGYYGAVQNKYLPDWSLTESAGQLASRWIQEFDNGIEGTSVKPGFIKISVDPAPLSDIHKKIVRAAALTHLKTGMIICSHTGPAPAAYEQIEILEKNGVTPNAFVWVHAQSEKDKSHYLTIAKSGAWISLDGIGWGNFDDYVETLLLLKKNNLLNRVLISHDAGWYKPDEPEAEFKGYTNIFTELWPRLEAKGFTIMEFEQLVILNPVAAFALHVR
jgi:phosphotriesterase-related protein